jgi:hypothetical protein
MLSELKDEYDDLAESEQFGVVVSKAIAIGSSPAPPLPILETSLDTCSLPLVCFEYIFVSIFSLLWNSRRLSLLSFSGFFLLV